MILSNRVIHRRCSIDLRQDFGRRPWVQPSQLKTQTASLQKQPTAPGRLGQSCRRTDAERMAEHISEGWVLATFELR